MSKWSELLGAVADRVRVILRDACHPQLVVPSPLPLEWAGRERGWMQTYTGRKFYPLSPIADDVHISDIAHGLAMTCRYGGHAQRFYSVAEHCVLVSHVVEQRARAAGLGAARVQELALAGLLHDSAEAYIGDMIRPLKHQPEMAEFRRVEAAIEHCVAARFYLALDTDTHTRIKYVDDRILVDEIRTLMPDPSMYLDAPAMVGLEPLEVSILGWAPAEAEHRFLMRFTELYQ